MTQIKHYGVNVLPSTAETGAIYLTSSGDMYVGTSANTFKEFTSTLFIDTLPKFGTPNKLYIHTVDGKAKLKVWNGTDYELLSGGEFDANQLEADIVQLQNELSTLKGVVDTAESKITANTDKIATLEAKVTDLENTEVEVDLSPIQTQIDSLAQLTTPYYPDKNIIFGQEYLSHFHKRIMNKSSNIITFSGDSTTNGYNVLDEFKIDKLFLEMTKDNGLENITTINRGFNNATVSQWANTYAQGDVNSNPNLLIARWGINSLPEQNPSKFEQDMRNALTIIRNQKDITQLSIVLMSPNSTSDPNNYRDMKQQKEINHIIRKLAREFRCVFIDTFAMFYDSVNSHDWMDNMQNANIHLHPSEVMNLWITSAIFDVVFPSNIVSKYGNKKTSNIVPPAPAKEIIIEDKESVFTSENVEDALLELFTFANNGKISVANAIGYPLNSNDTFSKIANKILDIKNTISLILNTKGVNASVNDSFDSFSRKINLIPEVTIAGNLKKISKLNITAPYTMTIELDERLKTSDVTSTLIEFVQGEGNVIHYKVEFDNDDKSDFMDNDSIVFDGLMKLNHEYELIPTTIESWSDTGFLQQIEIDSSVYQESKGITIY